MRFYYSLKFMILMAYITLYIEINLNKREFELRTTFHSI